MKTTPRRINSRTPKSVSLLRSWTRDWQIRGPVMLVHGVVFALALMLWPEPPVPSPTKKVVKASVGVRQREKEKKSPEEKKEVEKRPEKKKKQNNKLEQKQEEEEAARKGTKERLRQEIAHADSASKKQDDKRREAKRKDVFSKTKPVDKKEVQPQSIAQRPPNTNTNDHKRKDNSKPARKRQLALEHSQKREKRISQGAPPTAVMEVIPLAGTVSPSRVPGDSRGIDAPATLSSLPIFARGNPTPDITTAESLEAHYLELTQIHGVAKGQELPEIQLSASNEAEHRKALHEFHFYLVARPPVGASYQNVYFTEDESGNPQQINKTCPFVGSNFLGPLPSDAEFRNVVLALAKEANIQPNLIGQLELFYAPRGPRAEYVYAKAAQAIHILKLKLGDVAIVRGRVRRTSFGQYALLITQVIERDGTKHPFTDPDLQKIAFKS